MRASKALQQQQQMGKRAATKHIFGTADALFLREQVPVGSQFRSVMMARPLPPTASESCTPPAMVATSITSNGAVSAAVQEQAHRNPPIHMR